MEKTKEYASTYDLMSDEKYNYQYFENIILNLIAQYKQKPNFKYWYAAIGDNCNGKLDENFITIGMIDNENKINYSRIRIPKNNLGKKLIEKFVSSYLVNGIKEKNIIKNEGQNLNTVGYITTNDKKFFEIYTIKDNIIINGNNIDLDYFGNSQSELLKQAELDGINDKIDHINEMLGLNENRKTL